MAALDAVAGEKVGRGGWDLETLHMAAIAKHSRLLRKELLSIVKVHHFNAWPVAWCAPNPKTVQRALDSRRLYASRQHSPHLWLLLLQGGLWAARRFRHGSRDQSTIR